MPESHKAAPEEIAEVFQSLSNPLRVRILRLLLKRPMCVSRLSMALDVPQPTMSRNLGILRRAGLIRRVQCANFAQFAPAPPETFPELGALFSYVERVVDVEYDDEEVTRRLEATGTTPPKSLRNTKL